MPASPEPPSPPTSARHQEALGEFVALWGEMASRWGINRTMAQIHALLYASGRPLDTDEIMARLSISRGNANMNLRALVDWNLVRRSQQPGSRKDFYAAEADVWTITTTIIEERRKREIIPVQQALARCAATLREGPPLSAEEARLAARIDNLTGFLEVFEGFTSVFLPFLRGRNADKVKRVIQFARRLRREGPRGEGDG
jgi:DNA-binding transcriptional regulator GbsR (MarR family)